MSANATGYDLPDPELRAYVGDSVPGDPCVFDFEWLERDLAAKKWSELGLTDYDF